MGEENKSLDGFLGGLLFQGLDHEEKNKMEYYLKLVQKKDECNTFVTSSLFHNVRLGEARGRLENEIRLLQSRVNAMKATEEFLELSSEEMRKKISFISSELRRLEEDSEIKEHLKKSK